MLICLLLDNHSAYCSRETKRFLASKPDLGSVASPIVIADCSRCGKLCQVKPSG
jgi:hypothetical protein